MLKPLPAPLRFLTNRQSQEWMISDQRYFGRFVTPSTLKKQAGLEELKRWQLWGGDNGAWAGFKPEPFERLLEAALPYRATCKFIAAPDLPAANWAGDPAYPYQKTLELFEVWQPKISSMGYPVALCLHPGAAIENIQWDRIQAIFIGGTDLWRYDGKPKKVKPLSQVSRLIAHARSLGKYVHIGRMANSTIQIELAAFWGADSVDGMNEGREPNKFRLRITRDLRAVNGDCGIQLALAV